MKQTDQYTYRAPQGEVSLTEWANGSDLPCNPWEGQRGVGSRPPSRVAGEQPPVNRAQVRRRHRVAAQPRRGCATVRLPQSTKIALSQPVGEGVGLGVGI